MESCVITDSEDSCCLSKCATSDDDDVNEITLWLFIYLFIKSTFCAILHFQIFYKRVQTRGLVGKSMISKYDVEEC